MLRSVLPLFLCLSFSAKLCLAYTIKASVYKSPSELAPDKYDWSVKLGVADQANAAAYGSYDTDLDSNGGWRVLNVRAGYGNSTIYSQRDAMFAAGFLEGYLTQREIFEMYTNLYNQSLNKYTTEELQKVEDFYSDQRSWAAMMVEREGNTSRYWNYTALILAQFEGLMEGYRLAAIEQHREGQKLRTFAFDFLSGNGDFIDLEKMLFPSRMPAQWTYEDYQKELYSGHCSVLIKLLPGFRNLYASHSSWYWYASMLRIYKHYDFQLPQGKFPPPSNTLMSFSSYPGYLSSLDDFYIMNNGLLMLQTTNSIFNRTLYDQVTSSALLAWHRVRLANWVANGGEEWANTFKLHNSGTYNNQYMIVDLRYFFAMEDIRYGALQVIEQIPGLVQTGDQTAILRNGYWASYNIPFYENVYDMSGYNEAMKTMGDLASHQYCPRAKIFRRDQTKVVDLESMKAIMRYNNYKNEVYSGDNPMNTICSRGDLLNPMMAGGCTDTKITDYNSAGEGAAFIVNGPTSDRVPLFSWKQSGLPLYNLGQPDVFNYAFAKIQPGDPSED